MKKATQLLHAGQTVDQDTGSRAVPIYSTTSYVFDNTDHAASLFSLSEFGNIYSRLMNPTVDVFEKRLAAIDGGAAAVAFASGMAAITAAVCTLTKSGENIVSSASLYGGTRTLFQHTLPNLGITTNFFDVSDLSELENQINEKTRAVYIESLGNPKNDIPDFEKISEVAHKHGIPVIVDNTIPTPIQFRPLEHGADIVVYSATKYIGGHGTHVAGAVVDSGTFDWKGGGDKWPQFNTPDKSYHGIVFSDHFAPFGNIVLAAHIRTHWLRDTGAALSPFGAFLLIQGMETLHLRVPRHIENAEKVAKFLQNHPKVESVNHPSFESHSSFERINKYFDYPGSPIIGFEVAGGVEAGKRVINKVELASHLANIGDAKTLIIHPASTTHQQLSAEEQLEAGVTPGFIRLCVGIEDVDDIIADLSQSLEGI
jgi:O-acetylhomoserine (thiol)-lyase